MTVAIDPSDVRAAVPPGAQARRFPLRMIIVAGLGGCGLVGFTVAAFSFFSGLADPRVRTARPAPVAINLPDIKEGVPALAPEAEGSAPKAAAAPILNLPPPRAEPPAIATAEPDLGLRRDPPVVSTSAAPMSAASDATGSVAPRGALKAVPAIENAQTVVADAKPAPLIAPSKAAGPISPGKAETVRAKAAEPRAVAALSEPVVPEPARAASARSEKAKSDLAQPKRKPVASVHARTAAAKTALEASASVPGEASASRAEAASDDPEVLGVPIPGGRHIRDGIKSMFGGSDEN